MSSERARERVRETTARRWSLALGPAVVWSAHFGAAYAVVARVCETGGGWGGWALFGITVPAAAMIALLGLAAWGARGTEGPDEAAGTAAAQPGSGNGNGNGHEYGSFLPVLGLYSAPVFLVGVILTAAVPLQVPLCAVLAP